ncbi:hypothetical protein ACI2JA_19665 [Alkalihalobacillus sp. NPDC078783]|uniref:hypothetical protein n=1 Tax=Streptomyces albidoflavus TaxID=1886 RepID=UPI0033CF4D9D
MRKEIDNYALLHIAYELERNAPELKEKILNNLKDYYEKISPYDDNPLKKFDTFLWKFEAGDMPKYAIDGAAKDIIKRRKLSYKRRGLVEPKG